MSYYGTKGDFYPAEGYRGDPGFFSFIGKLASGASRLLGGATSIMPGGGIVSKISQSAVGGLVKRGVGVISKHPVLSAAGAAGVMSIGAGAGMEARRIRAARAGRMAGPGMRRHRRMRVTNPRALRRAIRRTQGFAKLAMRTIHLVHPRKKVRFGGFKTKRKR